MWKVNGARRYVLGALGALTVLCSSTLATRAFAVGYVGNVKITEVSLNGTVAWIAVSANIGGTRAPCHNAAVTRELAFNPTTTVGKAYLSLAQAARLSGKLVDVGGSTTCLAVGGAQVEVLGQMRVHN